MVRLDVGKAAMGRHRRTACGGPVPGERDMETSRWRGACGGCGGVSRERSGQSVQDESRSGQGES